MVVFIIVKRRDNSAWGHIFRFPFSHSTNDQYTCNNVWFCVHCKHLQLHYNCYFCSFSAFSNLKALSFYSVKLSYKASCHMRSFKCFVLKIFWDQTFEKPCTKVQGIRKIRLATFFSLKFVSVLVLKLSSFAILKL